MLPVSVAMGRAELRTKADEAGAVRDTGQAGITGQSGRLRVPAPPAAPYSACSRSSGARRSTSCGSHRHNPSVNQKPVGSPPQAQRSSGV